MKLVISETINGVVQVTEKESVIVIADFDTGSSAVPLATVTAKGSLIAGTANASVGELVVGANGTTLVADSSEASGMRWGSPAGAFTASDAENRTLSGTLNLTNADAYVQFCDPGGASRDINLPAVGVLNHPYWIYNSADADETLAVKNAGGTVIGILTRGKSGLFVSSNAGWSGVVDVLAPDINGWIPVLDTWTYATATTFTISGDKTGVLKIGDCLKLTQTTVKYFYVVNISYSSPNTTVTITAGSTYSLANATITSPHYSHIQPVDFPASFALTAPTWTTTGTAFTNQPTSSCKFWMTNKTFYVYIDGQANGTSGGTGVFIATFTSGQLPQPITTTASCLGTSYNLSNLKSGYGFINYSAPDAVRMALYDGTALFTNSQYFSALVIGAI